MTQLIEAEVQVYQSINAIQIRVDDNGVFTCPLEWWRQHEKDFPYLAKLAMKLLSIPVTSVPSERVFPAAGLTISKERMRLDPDRANELVFLHDTIPALQEYKKRVQSFE